MTFRNCMWCEQSWLYEARIRVSQNRLEFIGTRSPLHQAKRPFRLSTPGKKQDAVLRLGDVSGVFTSGGRDVSFVSERRSECGQTLGRGEDDVARIRLPTGMARRAVVTTVGLNTATIGIHGVDLRAVACSKWIAGFKEDAAVAEHVGRKIVCRPVSQAERFPAAEIQGFDHEPVLHLSGIDDAIVWQIKGPEAIVGGRCDTSGLHTVGCNFPDLPRIARMCLACKQNVQSVVGNRGIG